MKIKPGDTPSATLTDLFAAADDLSLNFSFLANEGII